MHKSLKEEILKEYPRLAPDSKFRFACHKGIPLKLTQGDGASIEFDYESAGIQPINQTCKGFLRLMWAFQNKPAFAPDLSEGERQ